MRPRRDDVACSSVEHMKSAVESLPALLEQKKELEKHTTILKGGSLFSK